MRPLDLPPLKGPWPVGLSAGVSPNVLSVLRELLRYSEIHSIRRKMILAVPEDYSGSVCGLNPTQMPMSFERKHTIPP
jgi:hypothetical protein